MLLSLDFLLLAAYVIGTFVLVPNPLIYRLINLDAEASLAAWWSSSQLLLAGIAFAIAGVRRHESPGPVFMMLCALALIFLSADEAASIHEKITMAVKGVEYLPRFSGDHGAWIPLYFVAALIFFAFTARSWMQLWRTRRRGIVIFFLGAAVFVFGAVVLEIASYGDLRDVANRQYYAYQVLFEEAFELVGVTTMLVGAIKICLEPEYLTPGKSQKN